MSTKPVNHAPVDTDGGVTCAAVIGSSYDGGVNFVR